MTAARGGDIAKSTAPTYPGGGRDRLAGMTTRSDAAKLAELPAQVSQTWRHFLEVYEPLRAALYRFCRYLSRSPWDAEDLVQDTLARAFATLGGLIEPPRDPRAWLFRVASNLWIDHVRRDAARPATAPAALTDGAAAEAAATAPDRITREAAGTLLVQLSPQERAAVVLKDAFRAVRRARSTVPHQRHVPRPQRAAVDLTDLCPGAHHVLRPSRMLRGGVRRRRSLQLLHSCGPAVALPPCFFGVNRRAGPLRRALEWRCATTHTRTIPLGHRAAGARTCDALSPRSLVRQ